MESSGPPNRPTPDLPTRVGNPGPQFTARDSHSSHSLGGEDRAEPYLYRADIQRAANLPPHPRSSAASRTESARQLADANTSSSDVPEVGLFVFHALPGAQRTEVVRARAGNPGGDLLAGN